MSFNEQTTLCFTKPKALTCSFRWTITDFTKCDIECGKCLESSRFREWAEYRKFTVKCYPKGYSANEAGYVSLLLCSNVAIFADVSFGIIDEHDNLKNIENFSGIITTDGCGCLKFVAEEALQRNNFLSGNNLTVHCQVTTYSIQTISKSVSKMNFSSARYNALSEDMNKLFMNNDFADVSVKVKGKEFVCCKNIVSCRSPFLGSKIKNEQKLRNIEIQNLESDVLEMVLRYLYSAKLPALSFEMAKKIVEAAELFQTPCLRNACFVFLKSQVNMDNVWEILEIAEKHGGQMLRKSCTDFIVYNASRLLQNDEKTYITLTTSAMASLTERIKNVRQSVDDSYGLNPGETCSLVWTIYDFKKCYCKSSEYLTSSKFYHTENQLLNFTLYLYPMGLTTECSDYISLNLVSFVIPDSHDRIHLKRLSGVYKFGIIARDGSLQNLCTYPLDIIPELHSNFRSDPTDLINSTQEKLVLDFNFHCKKFIPRNLYFDSSKQPPEKDLTLYCEVCVFPKYAEQTTPSPDEVALAPFKSLSGSFGKLLSSKEFSDVTFEVEGTEFMAHRNILAARSSVFDVMFKTDMEERNTGVVKITDIDADVFQALLRYLYTAEFSGGPSKFVMSLFMAADRFQVPLLKEMCSDYLKCFLLVDNACDIVLLADLYNEPELMNAGIDVMCVYLSFIGDWKEKFESKPHLMAKLLARAANTEQLQKHGPMYGFLGPPKKNVKTPSQK